MSKKSGADFDFLVDGEHYASQIVTKSNNLESFYIDENYESGTVYVTVPASQKRGSGMAIVSRLVILKDGNFVPIKPILAPQFTGYVKRSYAFVRDVTDKAHFEKGDPVKGYKVGVSGYSTMDYFKKFIVDVETRAAQMFIYASQREILGKDFKYISSAELSEYNNNAKKAARALVDRVSSIVNVSTKEGAETEYCTMEFKYYLDKTTKEPKPGCVLHAPPILKKGQKIQNPRLPSDFLNPKFESAPVLFSKTVLEPSISYGHAPQGDKKIFVKFAVKEAMVDEAKRQQSDYNPMDDDREPITVVEEENVENGLNDLLGKKEASEESNEDEPIVLKKPVQKKKAPVVEVDDDEEIEVKKSKKQIPVEDEVEVKNPKKPTQKKKAPVDDEIEEEIIEVKKTKKYPVEKIEPPKKKKAPVVEEEEDEIEPPAKPKKKRV